MTRRPSRHNRRKPEKKSPKKNAEENAEENVMMKTVDSDEIESYDSRPKSVRRAEKRKENKKKKKIAKHVMKHSLLWEQEAAARIEAAKAKSDNLPDDEGKGKAAFNPSR